MNITRALTALRLGRNVLQEDARRLYQLQVDVPIVEIHDAGEVLHHVLLAEEIEVRAAILLGEDDVLCQVSDHFHVELLVLVVDLGDALEALDQLAGKSEDRMRRDGVKGTYM
jgi:hypothetical protein